MELSITWSKSAATNLPQRQSSFLGVNIYLQEVPAELLEGKVEAGTVGLSVTGLDRASMRPCDATRSKHVPSVTMTEVGPNAMADADSTKPMKTARPSFAAEELLVNCRSLNGLPGYLEKRGLAYADLARKVGFADVDAASIETFVALGRFAHLLQVAAEATRDELFALRWTADDKASDLGSLPLCLRYAPTLRAALETLIRYLGIHIDVTDARFHADGGTARIRWNYSPLVLRQDQLADRTACLFVGWLAAVLPGTQPLQVKLTRKRPANAALHRDLLAGRVVFEAAENEIRFAGACLDAPNPAADAHLFRALCELNTRLLGERRRHDDLGLRVREEIARQLADGCVGLDTIARRVGLSGRALQRRLAANGTSFNDLLSDCRREAARRYIEDTDMMISEIAYRLGFSGTGNFTRAAKRWFGYSPREYRQALHSGRNRR